MRFNYLSLRHLTATEVTPAWLSAMILLQQVAAPSKPEILFMLIVGEVYGGGDSSK